MDITPKDYCKVTGMNMPTLTKRLRKKREVEHVEGIKKYSRFYLLIVSEDFNKKAKNFHRKVK